jgi:hypothetical protein
MFRWIGPKECDSRIYRKAKATAAQRYMSQRRLTRCRPKREPRQVNGLVCQPTHKRCEADGPAWDETATPFAPA